MKLKRVASTQAILTQGEAGNAFHVIVSGRVKVVILGQNGREVTLSILKEGESFGEISLFDGDSRAAHCLALEPTEVAVLSREDLLQHLMRHPGTAVNLLAQMARRLRKADETIAQLALNDVHERLVWQLIALAEEEGNTVAEGLLVRRRPTQQELANMIGSCRETISRAFNQLAREGLIVPRGRSMVVTRALLEKNRKNDAA
jgi:CRP-like cAMP-binding protein